MGMYEDEFHEIYDTIERNGLRKEYDTQMQKMNTQGKHKHKEIKDQMRYACDKVVNKLKEDKKL
tara:strand:- start:752 stop:943 length:192 start_codon:yes stop_codon:yes gene_type:complete